jgi:cobalt-zinc-cadmium efflux system protein
LQWIDPVVSIVIGLLIVWGTWGLLRESVNLAMDAVPEGIDPHGVEAYLCALPGVQSVHDLHIWGMSTTESALTVHLVMPEPPRGDAFLDEVCHELRGHFLIAHITIQIEHGDAECHQAPSHIV